MQKNFIQLASFVKDNSANLNIIYVPNNGNWGDGLIHRGQLKFFRHFGIKVNQISRDLLVNQFRSFNKKEKERFNNSSLLISGGGGSWCRNWRDSYEFVDYSSDFFKKIIVMPQTYELPKIKTDNITYFARDEFLSKKKNPESIFCHDMAFFANPPRFINFFNRSNSKDGNFFRSDKERNPLQKIPVNNIDISTKGNHLSNTYNFFRTISKYKLINTDRLHVAIASSLLNIKTNLYAGNYPKIESIFYSSIEPFFKSTILKKW